MKRNYRGKMVRPERFELPTYWFVASRSIQLSYGRTIEKYYHRVAPRTKLRLWDSEPRQRRAAAARMVSTSKPAMARGYPK